MNLSDAALLIFLKFNMMFAAVTVSTRDVRDYSPSAVMSLVQKYSSCNLILLHLLIPKCCVLNVMLPPDGASLLRNAMNLFISSFCSHYYFWFFKKSKNLDCRYKRRKVGFVWVWRGSPWAMEVSHSGAQRTASPSTDTAVWLYVHKSWNMNIINSTNI